MRIFHLEKSKVSFDNNQVFGNKKWVQQTSTATPTTTSQSRSGTTTTTLAAQAASGGPVWFSLLVCH
jgi:hypothetical protein